MVFTDLKNKAQEDAVKSKLESKIQAEADAVTDEQQPESKKASADDKTDDTKNDTTKVDEDEEEAKQQQEPEATFPQQLMDLIESETTSPETATRTTKASGDGTSQLVIEWEPNGEAFVIRDKALLEREVLPRYFSAKCKFMSFVRKLYR